MKTGHVLTFMVPLMFLMITSVLAQKEKNILIVNTDLGKDRISRHLYGHFSEHLGRCIYEGIWVGVDSPIPNTRGIRSDVVKALRDMKIPNLRWPGGCFADTYHWKDGIGPRAERPTIVNVHWGGVTEDNSFGTHEFMDLCGQLSCEPVICGNLGSGTVQEMMEWVEYLTSPAISPMTDLRKENGRDEPWKVSYWDIGNENWGCGGNMTPGYYADLMRRYSTFCRDYGENRLYRIACGGYGEDYDWTEVLMKEAKNRAMMQGLAIHYYTGTRGYVNRSATEFGEPDWFEILYRARKMDEIITKHSVIMDRYDPEKKIGLAVDEWGTWYEVEPGTSPHFLYQQNTLRDALVAATTLDIFNRHCDRVTMGNIAQTVNVLQSMILTKDGQMVLTPTYHVYRLYAGHHDATLLPADLQCEPYTLDGRSIPAVSASASRDDSGTVHISLSNLHPEKDIDLSCELRGIGKVPAVTGEILTAGTMNAHNDFDDPDAVRPVAFDGCTVNGGTLAVRLPAKSVVMLEIR